MIQQSGFRGNGIFQLIPKTGYGVEIGVFKGEFSEHILTNWKGILYMVDPFRPMNDYHDKSQHPDSFSYLNETIGNIHKFQDRGLPLVMTSEQASNLFADNSLDFVYIDGNHQYKYVKQDLELWYPKVKKGGYLMGDDYLGYDKEWWYRDDNWVQNGTEKDKELKKNGEYLGWFGVNSAVDEFVANKGIEMNQLDDNKLNPIGGITNSRKFNIWWGEFYFQKQEWTERKEPGGFVQWRKELQK